MSIRILSVFLLVLAFGLTACDENPVDDDHDHGDHAEDIEGLILEMDGAEVVRYADTELREGDTLRAAVGSETSSITVEFLDHDGDHVHADEFGDEFGLNFVFASSGVAEAVQHAGDGRWSFRLRGISADTTSLSVQLTHNDHPDFRTADIPLVVTESE